MATIGALLVLAAVTVGFAALTVWSFSVIRSFPGDDEPEVSNLKPVQIVGREQTVFRWTTDACEPLDYPDFPARVYRDADGQVNLIAAHWVNRRFVGPTLDRVKHRCELILRSGLNPDPAAFDDHEWLGSTYTPDGRNVYALVHDEYQGDKHPGRCATGIYLRCWYNTITFARSADGGASFSQPRPPRNVVAAVPYRYKPDQGHYGIFEPSNIVRSPQDGYYYALVIAQRYKRQQQGACVMRTRHPGKPGSWRAWDGTGFGVRFVDPYSPGASASDSTLCATVAYGEIGDMSSSLTFNEYLGKYVLVAAAIASQGGGRAVSGIYYSTSDDLIHWEPRKLIREAEVIQTYRCGDKNPVAYPSIVDPRSRSRNFDTVGRTAYMYFTRFHNFRCLLRNNRDLVRVRVRFTK